jgi:2'-5' RNA ligase
MAGTFVALKVRQESEKLLRQKLVGTPIHLPKSLHITLLYSKVTVPNPSIYIRPAMCYRGQIISLQYWDGHDRLGYLVAKIKSTGIEALHNAWIDRGGVDSFTSYLPHVTLATGMKKHKGVEWVRDFRDNLLGHQLFFGQEYWEPLSTGWAEE